MSYPVVLLADTTGSAGEALLALAASQLGPLALSIRRMAFVREAWQVKEALKEAQQLGCPVVALLADEALARQARQAAALDGVVCLDVLGPLIQALGAAAGAAVAVNLPAALQAERRVVSTEEAVHFAVRYDDGRKADESLALADVAVIGVSRTSKTPLCLYLGRRGLKAANLPLAPDLPVPDALYRMPASRIVGLTMRAERLIELREKRLAGLTQYRAGMSYASRQRVLLELDYAYRIMEKLRCRQLDITDLAVEEAAHYIAEWMRTEG